MIFRVVRMPDALGSNADNRSISDGTVETGKASDVAEFATFGGPIGVPMYKSQEGGRGRQYDHCKDAVGSMSKPTPKRHDVR